MENKQSHEYFMRQALKQAKIAYDNQECPIGCVIVKDSKIIARAHNTKVKYNDPINHAEILAIKKACKKLGDWRLTECTMYVTLEPCTMCTGALVQARLCKVYFGAYEPKSGAVVSRNNLLDISHGHNHKVDFEGGICEEEASQLLKSFFRTKRQSKLN